ncbi:conjugative transfer signal peptidase TraF [Sphingopyxis sp. YR583]|uniref:S26 family signal peptidase n=1 Tax=Sphingopyxis sp. YR583 TaxID=1881047 RepID=UPI0008A760E4|nr:S26 family signal peptidase [Sphingopyxis sp. YR583]SEH14908.1 conjugative transfer signal peptidase TraF [Sphingopyxis sp. YR583]
MTRRDKDETPRKSPWTDMPGERRARRRRLGTIAGAGLALATLPLIFEPSIRLLWNASPSVPVGLYHVARAEPRVGDLVVVRPPESVERLAVLRRYLGPGVPLLKPIVATAGAEVCRYGGRVEIDGEPAAFALVADRLGRPLPGWSGCRTLRQGEYFLLAPATLTSFDSRYFGPVDRGTIIGRATPIWTGS